MLKLEKLLLIFTNPKRFSKGLVRYFNWFVLENLVRITSFMMFNICPQYLHLIYGKALFSKNERWERKNNPEDEWIHKGSKIIFNEINILCRGTSLKKYIKKINRKIPTFFINYTDDPSINFPGLDFTTFRGPNFYPIAFGFFTKKNEIHSYQLEAFRMGIYPAIVCRDGKALEDNKKILWSKKFKAYPNANYLKKINNQLPERWRNLYKIYEKKKLKIKRKTKKIVELIDKKGIVHSKNYDDKYWGAALPVIFLLGSSAKKINIYGWDQYLKKDIDKFNYWELIKAMSYQGGISVGPYGSKCREIVSETIFNFHYANRLIEQKKYKIFSRLSKIKKQKKILAKIEKMLF